MKTNNCMKMVTGLVSMSGSKGAALRIAAFAAMAMGCWRVVDWATTLDWSSGPGFVTGSLALFAIVNVMVPITIYSDGRSSHLPFPLWRQMMDEGRFAMISEPRITAILVAILGWIGWFVLSHTPKCAPHRCLMVAMALLGETAV